MEKIYDACGESGFSQSRDSNQSYKQLETENQRLKKLLVDKELALEAQRELLKKLRSATGAGQLALGNCWDRRSKRPPRGKIMLKVREYPEMVGLEQEFTHVATPEEKGHDQAYPYKPITAS